MKMTLKTAELVKALYRVQGIADKKSSMPILAHVLLDATQEDKLIVSATDLDVGLSGTYGAKIEKPGAVAVHARQLYDVVKSLSHEELHLERLDNSWIEITAGTSRFKLVGMSSDEFPALPSHNDTKTVKIPSETLAKMIDRTLFCVSTDDNRHNLSGVYCEVIDNKTLRMVATDGHRLGLSESQFDFDLPIDSGVIVPRKGFQELRRVLQDNDAEMAEVELGFSGSNGLLKVGQVILSTRLVEGQFPDYQQVIPDTSTKTATIARGPLAESLRRVSLLSQGRAYGVRMNFSEGNLELVAEDPEFGEARETLEITYSGEPLSIGFNAKYILDVLALVQDEAIRLELSDDLSPGIIRPLEEQGFLAVIMPMRI